MSSKGSIRASLHLLDGAEFPEIETNRADKRPVFFALFRFGASPCHHLVTGFVNRIVQQARQDVHSPAPIAQPCAPDGSYAARPAADHTLFAWSCRCPASSGH